MSSALSVFRSTLRNIQRYYPFTFAGTLLFAVSLRLLYGALTHRNAYEFLISVLALLALIVLSSLGRLQAARFSKKSFEWDTSEPLFARVTGLSHWFHTRDARALLFYRIHFCLTGTLSVGLTASLLVHREIPTVGGERVSVPLAFPLSGTFNAVGRFRVRDIFGLTQARFGTDLLHRLPVRPAIVSETDLPPLSTQQSSETANRKKSAEEEKYYMREYIPGDRLRDINWKASGRLNELVTKISPLSEERTRVVNIQFRNLTTSQRDTVESIVHLDCLKSWMLSFARGLKIEHPTYQLRIMTTGGTFTLDSERDLEELAVHLSDLRLQNDTSNTEMQTPIRGDVFVFSTPYDTMLASFLSYMTTAKAHVYRTAFSSGVSADGGQEFHVLRGALSYMTPGRWIAVRDRGASVQTTQRKEDTQVQQRPLRVKLL